MLSPDMRRVVGFASSVAYLYAARVHQRCALQRFSPALIPIDQPDFARFAAAEVIADYSLASVCAAVWQACAFDRRER